LASPSPLCFRAHSTPGRRAVSSFGSSVLFRETPSPRTKPQRGDAKLQSPAPATAAQGVALQPRSLMFSPPPRYGGAAPPPAAHAATHATTCSPAQPAPPPLPGSGIGRCGTSPNKAVPAFPSTGRSPVRALPGGISVTAVVARSPSAPCLGRSDAVAVVVRHGGRWLSHARHRRGESADGGTPRNLSGFRKSLEMALASDISQTRKQQQQHNAKPWK